MYCYSMTTDAIYEEYRSDWSHQVSAGAMMVAAWSDPSSLRRVWLVRLGWGQEILAVLSCVLQGHWDNQQQSSNVLQTPLLVLNPFIFMHQVKKFGAEILFIPYFSSSSPPSHSPCLVVSAVTITFLLEPPVRNESSSSGPPSGNTNQFSINFFTKSFVTALILTGSTWLQFFVRSYSIWKSLIYLKKATTINSRDENTTCTQAAESRHLAEF